MYTPGLLSFTCVSMCVLGGGETIELGLGGGRYITRNSHLPFLLHNQVSNDYLFVCLFVFLVGCLSICLFLHTNEFLIGKNCVLKKNGVDIFILKKGLLFKKAVNLFLKEKEQVFGQNYVNRRKKVHKNDQNFCSAIIEFLYTLRKSCVFCAREFYNVKNVFYQ